MYSNLPWYALSERLPALHWDGYCELVNNGTTVQIVLLWVRRGEEGWNVHKAIKL